MALPVESVGEPEVEIVGMDGDGLAGWECDAGLGVWREEIADVAMGGFENLGESGHW